jgi:hypothetical protein
MGLGLTEFKKGMRDVGDDAVSGTKDPPRPAGRPASPDGRIEPTAPRFDPPSSPPAGTGEKSAS